MKTTTFFLALLTFFMTTIFAKDLNYNFKDFNEAEKSEEFLSFTGESTKFKIITTEFSGFAKKFSMQYELKGEVLSKVIVTLEAKSIDTDNSSRNEKLYTLCLKTDSFPNIKVAIETPITLSNGSEGEVQALLTIKDKTLMRPVKYKVLKVDAGFKVNFSSDFSFSEAGIDDPSIAIAKVHDIFQIKGVVIFKP